MEFDQAKCICIYMHSIYSFLFLGMYPPNILSLSTGGHRAAKLTRESRFYIFRDIFCRRIARRAP